MTINPRDYEPKRPPKRLNEFLLAGGDDSWRLQANCNNEIRAKNGKEPIDPDIFFPERGDNTKVARSICGECPVEHDCREWAIAIRQKEGIAGGLTARDRKILIRARRRAEGKGKGKGKRGGR